MEYSGSLVRWAEAQRRTYDSMGKLLVLSSLCLLVIMKIMFPIRFARRSTIVTIAMGSSARIMIAVD